MKKNAFTDYQKFCLEGIKPGGHSLAVFALGLGGESGEVLDIIKKSIRDEHPIDLEHLKEELGDVLWYVANIASATGIDLNDILKFNIDKLTKRYSLGGGNN